MEIKYQEHNISSYKYLSGSNMCQIVILQLLVLN